MECWILLLTAVISCYTVSVGIVEAQVEAVAVVCKAEVKICLDGTMLNRDPSNNCWFPRCPSNCPEDLKECPDGTFVPRNQNDPHCRFFQCSGECPSGSSIIGKKCDKKKRKCPDGYYCEKGEPGEDGSSKGWCCPDISNCTNIQFGNEICDDGTAEFQDLTNCPIPPCWKICPNGQQGTGQCSLFIPCEREQLCVYGTLQVNSHSIGWCCPSGFWEELCEYEEHIWRDYIGFLNTHKALVAATPTPGTSKIRVQFDKIYEMINCINELICKVKEKKQQIKEGQINRNGIGMIRCLWDWISEIMKKADAIEVAVNKLRKWHPKPAQVIALDELNRLKASCLMEAFKVQHKLAIYAGHAKMRGEIIILEKHKNFFARDICVKATELGDLYHIVFYDFGDIYEFISGVFKQYASVESIPAAWFNEKIQCLNMFEQLYYDISDCCEAIARGENFKLDDIVKKLGSWLKRAMDLREIIRSCFPRNSAVALKKTIIGMDKNNTTLAAKAVEVEDKVNSAFRDFLKQFDDCIIKMRCMFLEFVEQFWQHPGQQISGLE